MNTHADKIQENKSQTVAAETSQMRSGGESTLQFVANRPEAIAQRKLQEMANNSQQVSQLRAFQDMANNSPQVKQAAELQAMADNYSIQQQLIQKKASPEPSRRENNTGLPDNLKTGMENLSGLSLDDVKVHRNSDKPSQLQAHAYAQGTDIHLGPGQEKHLPHEAWHVVQQKQGRVKPTMQMKGKININDDAGLEKEADVMGAKALHLVGQDANVLSQNRHKNAIASTRGVELVQRVTEIEHNHEKRIFKELEEKKPEPHTVGVKMIAKLDPDDAVTGSAVPSSNYAWMESLNRKTKNLMIRGHLLNHDLGGFGVPENLYPISTGANKQHSVLVENPVKSTLKSAMDKKPISGKKPRVIYGVEVYGNGLNVYFDCKWKMEDHPNANDDDKKLRHVKIKSDPGGKTQTATGVNNQKENQSEVNKSNVSEFIQTDWGHENRKGRVGGSEEEHAEGDGPTWDSYKKKLKLNGDDIEKIEWGKSDPSIQKEGLNLYMTLFTAILDWHKIYYKEEILLKNRKKDVHTGFEEVMTEEYEVDYHSHMMYRLIGVKGESVLQKMSVIIKKRIIAHESKDAEMG